MLARCFDLVGLGYIEVDVILDRNHGPLMLEMNARPGLSIQIATQWLARLGKIKAMKIIPGSIESRVSLAKAFLF